MCVCVCVCVFYSELLRQVRINCLQHHHFPSHYCVYLSRFSLCLFCCNLYCLTLYLIFLIPSLNSHTGCCLSDEDILDLASVLTTNHVLENVDIRGSITREDRITLFLNHPLAHLTENDCTIKASIAILDMLTKNHTLLSIKGNGSFFFSHSSHPSSREYIR